MTDAIKVGKRHSATDEGHIQEIYRRAVALGAMPDPPATATGEIPIEAVSEPMKTAMGAAIKALGDGKIGGYLVLFGDATKTDTTGDYFTAKTDFGDAMASPVLYHHGLDETLGLKHLGSGALKRDEVGVWIEAQLDMRDAYTRAIYDRLVVAGKVGWSSGTAPHLVARKQVRPGVYEIERWPLGLDASLTPTPAEPRTAALPIKSLLSLDELQDSAQVAGDATTPSDGTTAEAQPQTDSPQEGDTMDKNEMTEAVKAAVSAALAERDASATKAAAAAPGYELPTTDIKSIKVEDVPKQPYGRFADFLKAVRERALDNDTPEDRARLLGHQDAAIKSLGANTQVGADGGFLIGPNDSAALADNVWSTGEILARVSRNSVSANANGMTMYGIDETSRVDGSRYGGIRGYWGAEGGTLTGSKPKWKTVELKLNKVHALFYATDEMLADAAFLEGKVLQTIPREITFQVENAIITGTGVGQPLGILKSPALITQTKESAQTAATVNINNLTKMWGRLPAQMTSNAVLFYNQDVTAQLFAIASTATSTTAAAKQALLQTPAVAGGKYFTFNGLPMIPVEYCSTLGTVGDVILADLSQYQVIDKGGIQSAVSMHVQFLTDEMVYRFTYRVDGRPTWASPVTPLNGSNTVSPFVTLEAR